MRWRCAPCLDRRSWQVAASNVPNVIAEYRGVSSTVKLSVSKTELLGSNPSAPAITTANEVPDAG
jgi:hypothetical protein